MSNGLERFIKMVYRKCKASGLNAVGSRHPNEEEMACFLEGRLSPKEHEKIKTHLISCDRCAEIFALRIKLDAQGGEEEISVDSRLITQAKALVEPERPPLFEFLEIFLKVKERAFELLHTSGDVIVGQELVPAAVLRSRHIQDFKDEVSILKDFPDFRVEAKIENKGGKAFNLTVVIKDKKTQQVVKDLRVALVKEEQELESYITDKGSVTFEHVLVGKYTVEISRVESKLATILLEIKK